MPAPASHGTTPTPFGLRKGASLAPSNLSRPPVSTRRISNFGYLPDSSVELIRLLILAVKPNVA